MDAEKIPIITEAQLRALHFDFEQEKFHRQDSRGRFDASEAILRHEFRNHFETKGLVYTGIKDFMGRDDKKYIDDNIENWEPSCATGVFHCQNPEPICVNKEAASSSAVSSQCTSSESKKQGTSNKSEGVKGGR